MNPTSDRTLHDAQLDRLLLAALNDAVEGSLGRQGLAFVSLLVVLGVAAGVATKGPDWWALSVPMAVVSLFGIGWWLAHSRRLTRGMAFALSLVIASLPGLRTCVAMLWDPLAPAIHVYSPDVGLWVIVIVFAGALFDRRFSLSLGIWIGAQSLALFAVGRSALGALDGPPALTDNLASTELAVVRALMLVGLSLFVGQQGVLVRAIVRDVLERLLEEEHRVRRTERARSQAQRLSEAKSAFLLTIGHELRAPLQAALGHTEQLLDRSTLDAPVRDGLEAIHSSGAHLRSLAEDILDLSSIESGHVRVESRRVHLPGLVREVAVLLRVGVEDRGSTLTLDIAEDVPEWVFADPKRLRQVLINLADNASKFTEGGQVRLEVSRTTGIRFCVRDTGAGIEAESLDAIFEPFQQAGTSAQHRRGVGLGLAISQRLVRLMGGELEVESQLGLGSAFSFELPLEASPMDAEPPTGAGEEPIPPTELLEPIRALAYDGNLKEVERLLPTLEPAFVGFARRIRRLVDAFEDEALLAELDAAACERAGSQGS